MRLRMCVGPFVSGAREDWLMRKINVRIFCTSLSVPLALLLACSLCAQTGTTSLRGSILDKSGGAIAGAKVKLVKLDQGLEYETTSNAHGEYQFVLLSPGTYSLLVQADGFRRFEQHNMELLVSNPTTNNVTLEVGSTTQTVEVSAQAETLNTTDASLGIAFGENQVKELPLEGRNVPDLLTPTTPTASLWT